MSIIDNTATDKADVYRKVTDAIITAIEQGVGNWRMPWHTSGRYAFSPINVTSKKPIQGNQHAVLMGRCPGEGIRIGRMGNVQTMAGTRRPGVQRREGHYGGVLEVRE